MGLSFHSKVRLDYIGTNKEPVPNGHTSGGGADLDLLVVFFPGSCKHEGTQGQELLLLQLKIPPPVQ